MSSATHSPSDPTLLAPALPVAHYQFRFQQLNPDHLPASYLGSAWRGALGRALKSAVCVTRMPECGGCMLRTSCSYAYVFETPVPTNAEKMRRYPHAPHPFALSPDPKPLADEPYRLGLTLFGRGTDHLPFLVHALRAAGEEGLGSRRARLALMDVYQETMPGSDNWERIYSGDQGLEPLAAVTPRAPTADSRPVRLQFETPLRLQRGGRFIGPEDLAFADLFSNLLRRVSMLTYFHTETPLELDFRQWVERARALTFETAVLDWRDWSRYSSRQERRIKMGGIVGQVTLDGAQVAPFWPLVWLGQWTHAGKGTSMGLGRYRIYH